jgi:hypothetical protein
MRFSHLAALTAIDLLKNATHGGLLRIAPNESHWLGNLRETLDEMPDSEDEFISQQLALADPSKFLPAEYGL